MRPWLMVTVLLALGCGKQKEEPVKRGPKEAEAAPAPKQDDKKPAPPPKDVPALDCGALVTPADLEKACGVKVDLAATNMEAKTPLTACMRAVTAPGKKFPIAHVQVGSFGSPAAAAGYAKLEKGDDGKSIDGIGDGAWSRVVDEPNLKLTRFTVGTHKGRLVLTIKTDKSSLNPKPPCTIEQMTELAKVLVTRLL